MSEPKFTKGEWQVTYTQSMEAENGITGEVINLLIGGYSHPMAVTGIACTVETNKRYQEEAANVFLMKTSPKLYQKLQAILDERCAECHTTIDVDPRGGSLPCMRGEKCPYGMDEIEELLKEARGEE